MTTAPCTATDPELFFPPTYGGTHKHAVLAAKALCKHCPLRRECLDRALADGEVFGIWGGTTPEERTVLATRRR